MSIGGTNRIIDPKREFNKILSLEVSELNRQKRFKKQFSFKEMGKALILCSQCKRWFDKKIGDIQIENKRENAPICIPCIMGIPRRIVTIDRTAGWKPETKEKLKKWKESGRTGFNKDKKLKAIPKESSPFKQ